MRKWLSSIFRARQPAPDNSASLSAGLLSRSEDTRNRVAEAILEKAVTIRAPFRRWGDVAPADPGSSVLRRLWEDIKSLETTCVDLDAPGNRPLLEQLVRAVHAGDVSPGAWQMDARIRWQALIEVMGEKKLNKILQPGPNGP